MHRYGYLQPLSQMFYGCAPVAAKSKEGPRVVGQNGDPAREELFSWEDILRCIQGTGEENNNPTNPRIVVSIFSSEIEHLQRILKSSAV